MPYERGQMLKKGEEKPTQPNFQRAWARTLPCCARSRDQRISPKDWQLSSLARATKVWVNVIIGIPYWGSINYYDTTMDGQTKGLLTKHSRYGAKSFPKIGFRPMRMSPKTRDAKFFDTIGSLETKIPKSLANTVKGETIAHVFWAIFPP